MKLFTAQLFVLASSLTSFALSVRTGSIPQSLVDACPSAHVISSSTIIVDGQDVVRQVFSCPDGNLTAPAIPEANLIPSSNIAQRSAIEARSAAECTTPAAECQCGQVAVCGCFGDTPGTVHATSLRTCAVSFTNLGSTAEEYCWDDLATQVNSEIGCINERNEVTCVAETQRFVIHMGVAV
ncbi:hypothetical protein ACEPAH_1642 [Sanghuangporus vaninii]